MTPAESALLGILLIALTLAATVWLGILIRPRAAALPNPLLHFNPAIPRYPLFALSSSPQAAESINITMASFLQNILAKFVAPEEHALGKALAAAYAANKPAVIAALSAEGVKAQAVLEADADLLIDKAFAAVPYGSALEVILGPELKAQLHTVIENAVATAGGEGPVIEAFADRIVASIEATLEAA